MAIALGGPFKPVKGVFSSNKRPPKAKTLQKALEKTERMIDLSRSGLYKSM
jgi:hypothetical protein